MMSLTMMRRIEAWLIVLVMDGLLIACAPPNTGINGQVDLGPACPENTNCTYPSGPATVQVSNDRGDPIASVKTDENGNFAVPVGPGTYIIQAMREGGFGPGYTSPPLVVNVTQGRYLLVRLSLTGQ